MHCRTSGMLICQKTLPSPSPFQFLDPESSAKNNKSHANVVVWSFSLRSRREVVTVRLEAFAVDDGWSRLIILLLANPHLLEGGQGGQDGTSDPDRVFTLRWGNDLGRDERLANCRGATHVQTQTDIRGNHRSSEHSSPWFSLCWGPGMWSPSASYQQCQGTWWYHQTIQCWHTGPYGCRRHTSWWSWRWSHGYRKTPYLQKGRWMVNHPSS